MTYFDVQCFFTRKDLKGANTATASPQKLDVELSGKLQPLS